MGYIGFLREKKWGLAGIRVAGRRELAEAARNSASEVVERARVWTRAPLLDTTLSFTFVILVTLLFAVLGAMVLNPNRAIPDGSEFLTVQESFLTALHPQLKWLYRVGVFLAFIGTLYGAFEVYSRVISEGVRSLFPRFVDRPFFESLPNGDHFLLLSGRIAAGLAPQGDRRRRARPHHLHRSGERRNRRLRTLVLRHDLGRPSTGCRPHCA